MMGKIRLYPLILGLLLLTACGTRLDRQTLFLKYQNNTVLAQMEEILSAFQSETMPVGMSVGILKEEKVHFFNYGTAYAGGNTVTEDTIFELGAVTEIFTGHIFGEYVFRGYFTPDTVITRYYEYLNLPLWKDGTAPTNQDLATHRSGFEGLPDNLPQEAEEEYDELALRRYLSQSALENQPGAIYNPNGMDYGLLGFVLKTQLKQDYEEMVKYSIMYRIGMTNTTLTLTDEQEEALALPHDLDGNVTHFPTYKALYGMSGFKSTAYDLINYATVHMNRFAISQRDWDDLNSGGDTRIMALGRLTLEQRMTGAVSVATATQYSDEEVTIGYGYQLGEINGEKYAWQSASDIGYATYFGIVPGTNTAVVILVNSPIDVEGIGKELLTLLQP